MKSKIKLKATCISSVPLHKYDQNFTFIVNGQSFTTNRIIADLLSPKISQIHFIDSTFDNFIIETNNYGSFQYFLDLVNFSENDIPENEIPFLKEIIEILGNKSIEICNHDDALEVTFDNVFDLIKIHDQNHVLHDSLFQREIDYISSHFSELNEKQLDELVTLKISTIESIISNPKLQLKIEDQLLKFINQLYLNDSNNSYLYEYVEFLNVTGKTIKEFLDLFDMNDITKEIWKLLSFRLEQEIIISTDLTIKTSKKSRYDGILIPYIKNQEFNGIINYIRKNLMNKITDEINITASSNNYQKTTGPQNVILFDDQTKDFRAINSGDVWICIDFKNHSLIPSHYTIRSFGFDQGYSHPKSWVIEGSNDNYNWIKLDEQNDCPLLNGKNLVYTFTINEKKIDKFQFIRMRQTGLNWDNNRQLSLDSIEFYGKLYLNYNK